MITIAGWVVVLGERGAIRRIEAVRVGQDVAETMLQYATKNNIDVIVMATHGRTGLTRPPHGQRHEKVLTTIAPCPVLVLRPREPS